MFWHFGQLWYLARDATLRSVEIERRNPPGMPGDAIAAIVMAASAVEAFINEAAFVTESHVASTPDGFPDPVVAFSAILMEAVQAKTDIRIKYQLASTTLTGLPFRKGEQPYQDFADLVRLRNWLVHLSPEPPQEVIVRFRDAGLTLLPTTFEDESGALREATVSGVDLISTSRMARWACEASKHQILRVIEMFPDCPGDPISILKETFVHHVSQLSYDA
ncbi:MAG: hypothetical protein ACRDZW_02005 [Acidimicrobiales bacterium]